MWSKRHLFLSEISFCSLIFHFGFLEGFPSNIFFSSLVFVFALTAWWAIKNMKFLMFLKVNLKYSVWGKNIINLFATLQFCLVVSFVYWGRCYKTICRGNTPRPLKADLFCFNCSGVISPLLKCSIYNWTFVLKDGVSNGQQEFRLKINSNYCTIFFSSFVF